MEWKLLEEYKDHCSECDIHESKKIQTILLHLAECNATGPEGRDVPT